MQSTKSLVEGLDNEIRALIEKYHTTPALSLSSYQETRTSNRYQSLDLRGTVLQGFRAADRHIYTGLPLNGLSFVDLGCNVGEKTRFAADAGVSFAEGIEYDEFFVRIGNLVSVYNRYENILLRQGDMTKPGLLKRRYGAGASFSSFVYLKDTLGEILSGIDRLFICETHALTDGWFPIYVPPVSDTFPYWVVYGFTDHGGIHKNGRRALLLFVKQAAPIGETVARRAALLPPDYEAIQTIDIEASPLAQSLVGRGAAAGRPVVEALRRELRRVAKGDRAGLASVLGRWGGELRAVAGPETSTTLVWASDGYWAAVFQGAAAYLTDGSVRPDNPLLVFLRKMTQIASLEDLAVANLFRDETSGPARVAERLDGFLDVLLNRHNREHLIAFNPIHSDLVPELGGDALEVVTTTGEAFRYQAVDGHHRMAACWLAAVPTCTMYFCWTNMLGLTGLNFARLGAGLDGENRATDLIQAAVLRYATGRGAQSAGETPAVTQTA